MWELECQKAFLPCGSFHVYNVRVPSPSKGVAVSTTVSPNLAEITFRANPSLMLLAISMGVVPSGTCFTAPSGNVILIIYAPCNLDRGQRYQLAVMLTIGMLSK